jgi:catechol 2,3-dioxygenase-like lactoylglutathione lyase family enzyme
MNPSDAFGKLLRLDHFVLTTKDLEKCLSFYKALGMKALQENGRWALYFGNEKINIHTKPGEFQPAAAYPKEGALDLCFVLDGDLSAFYQHVQKEGLSLVTGIVDRHGALGPMKSFYLRDPDGNLVEICQYPQTSEGKENIDC